MSVLNDKLCIATAIPIDINPVGLKYYPLMI